MIVPQIFRSSFKISTSIIIVKPNLRESTRKFSNLPKDNLAAVLHGINDLRLEQRPIPSPKENQVLLKMEVVGICGSDVHYFQAGRIGPYVVECPMVIGHEGAGTVVECGKNVKTLKPGDRVAVEPGVPCRRCEYCKRGRYNMCPHVEFCATPPVDGNLARYYAHDEDFCFKLPPCLDLEDGALMEPLAVGVHVCKRTNVTIGDSVLIFGAGPIGLVTMMVARAYGASQIFVADILPVKIKKAKELGADHVIRICEDMNEDDVVRTIVDTMGCQPNVTFDCCGAEQAYKIGLKATKTGGKMAALGLGADWAKISLMDLVFRELEIIGSSRYANDYQTAIELVASGKVCVKPLITHEFQLEDTLKAFDTAINKDGDPIKILIHANPDWKSNDCMIC